MRGTTSRRLRRLVVLAAAVAGAAAGRARGGPLGPATWDGDAPVGAPGDNTTWGNTANWTTGGSIDTAPPDAAPGADLVFGNGTAGATIDLGADRIANSLTLSRDYTLGTAGTAFTLTNTTGAFAVSPGVTTTLNAVLDGSGGITLTGGGTLALARTGNTFTGNVSVDGFGTTLRVVGSGDADPTALGAAGPRTVTLTGGGTFSLGGTADFHPPAGTKSFVIGAGGGTIDVAAGRTLLLDNSGQFSGTGAFTKTGQGTLFLDPASGYSGPMVNVAAGTLTIGNGGLSEARLNVPVTVSSGATFDLRGDRYTLQPITVGGGGVGGGGGLVVGNSANAAFVQSPVVLTADTAVGGPGLLGLNGVVSDGAGTFNLTKVGPGVLSLQAANTYKGNTVVAGGTLRGAFGTGLPATTNLSLAGGAFEPTQNYVGQLGTGPGQVQLPGGPGGFSGGGQITLNGNATLVWGATPGFKPSPLILGQPTSLALPTFTNPIDLNGATREVAANAPLNAPVATMSGAITDGVGGGVLVKTGPGVLALTNPGNAYTGGTTVSGGVLRATDGSSLPSAGNLTLNGGVLESGGSFVRPLGTGSGQVQLPGGASGFSAFGGPAVVNLGGAGATLQWGSSTFNPTALVLNAETARSTIEFQNGIDLNGADRTIAPGGTAVPERAIALISGPIVNSTGSAGPVIDGAGVVVFTSANTYNGTTTLRSGTLSVSADNNLGAPTTPVAMEGGTLRVIGVALRDFGSHPVILPPTASFGFDIRTESNNFTLPATTVLQPGQTLAKSGPGTLTLSNPSNALKSLVMNEGTLELGAGSLTVTDGIANVPASITVSNINASGGGSITIGSGGTNGMNSVRGTLTINARVIGTAGFDVSGGHIVLANPANDFPGDVFVSGTGTLVTPMIGTKGANGNLGRGTAIYFNKSGTPADFVSAGLQYVGSGETTDRDLVLNKDATLDQSGTGLLKFTGTVTAGTGPKTLTLEGSTAGEGEIASAIPDGTDVLKTGTGQWTLSGTNTYSGTTTVQQGTLLVTGTAAGQGDYSIAAPPRVIAPAILGGRGTIGLAAGRAVTVGAYGVLAPGGGSAGRIGTLTIAGDGNGVSFAGGTFAVDTGPAGTADLLSVTGPTGNFAASTAADALAVTATDPGTFTILTYTGTRDGAFDFVTLNGVAEPGVLTGSTFTASSGDLSVFYDDANGRVVLTLNTAVPEPAALGTLGVGAAGLLLRRRRRTT